MISSMRKTIILGIIGAVILGGGAVLYYLPGMAGACTEIGCIGQLMIQDVYERDVTATPPSYIEIDGTVILDDCNNIMKGEWQENDLRVQPSTIGHTSSTEVIETIRLGHHESCSDGPEITQEITDITVDYTKQQPNGPGCPPTCLSGEITLE